MTVNKNARNWNTRVYDKIFFLLLSISIKKNKIHEKKKFKSKTKAIKF